VNAGAITIELSPEAIEAIAERLCPPATASNTSRSQSSTAVTHVFDPSMLYRRCDILKSWMAFTKRKSALRIRSVEVDMHPPRLFFPPLDFMPLTKLGLENKYMRKCWSEKGHYVFLLFELVLLGRVFRLLGRIDPDLSRHYPTWPQRLRGSRHNRTKLAF